VALLAATVIAGCQAKKTSDETTAPLGMNTYSQARRYVDKAVRRSSEGVILMPSKKAETLYDRTRLNEIAQALRVPAAVCFVNRAIATMKRGARDGETAYVDVPEGQIRIRARINPSGEVLRTEVLESGFQDEQMYPCLDKAIKAQKWIQNRTGVVQYIDVVYWVSLGFQAEDHSDEARAELRRQQAAAAAKAKRCLVGRVGEGRYPVEGLSLLDRDGRTLANRVDPGPLPDKVRECVAIMFREIRMPRISDAFVRPIEPRAEFTVTAAGEVSFADERWLRLLQLEEEAMKEARRAEGMDDLETAIDGGALAPEPPAARETPTPPLASTPAPRPNAAADPAAGGMKLRLGGHRGGETPR
jgi:hypothetical protein